MPWRACSWPPIAMAAGSGCTARRRSCAIWWPLWGCETCCLAESVEVGRQTKEWEEPLGVEEEGEFDDPIGPSFEHHQRPGIAPARLAWLVLAECDPAVGARCRQQT